MQKIQLGLTNKFIYSEAAQQISDEDNLTGCRKPKSSALANNTTNFSRQRSKNKTFSVATGISKKTARSSCRPDRTQRLRPSTPGNEESGPSVTPAYIPVATWTVAVITLL